MPYVWGIGLIWFGMHGSVFGVATWCSLFVVGAWLIEVSKPFIRLLQDREALAWTIEVAILTATSSSVKIEGQP